MAERAIRQLAVQRKISGFLYEDGARRYLRLLAIAQSCRFQETSFLRFLLSSTKDLDAFKASGKRRWSSLSNRASRVATFVQKRMWVHTRRIVVPAQGHSVGSGRPCWRRNVNLSQ